MSYQDKYLDATGVEYLWNKADELYQKKEAGKSLSDNNFTTAEKNKLASLENYVLPNASANTLGGIKIGSGLIIDANGVVSTVLDPDVDWSDINNLPTTLDGYGITDAVSQDEFEEFIASHGGLYRYRGTVATVADLALINNPQNGDVYGVEENGNNYAWNEAQSRWDNIGSIIAVESITTQEIDNICQ